MTTSGVIPSPNLVESETKMQTDRPIFVLTLILLMCVCVKEHMKWGQPFRLRLIL